MEFLFSCPLRRNNIVTELCGTGDAFNPSVTELDAPSKIFHAFSTIFNVQHAAAILSENPVEYTTGKA